MKRLLTLLAILVTLNAYSQNTTTLPTPTTSFAPSFRYYGTLLDSLRQTWMQTPGGGWNRMVTMTEANLRYAPYGSGVASFNGRVGAVALLGADVTTALGYTPVPTTRQLINGYGITGGGTLATDRTITVDTTTIVGKPNLASQMALKERLSNKQNSLTTDGTGVKYPTVDAINAGVVKYTDTVSTIATHTWVKNNPVLPNGLIRNIPTTVNSVVWLGDSFSTATSATSFQKGVSFITQRSILNATDKGFPNDRGLGYYSFINMTDLLASGTGVSTTGSVIASGVTNARLSLTAGQTITITGMAINYADIIYNATNSTGTLQIKINGTLVKTRTLSGTGIQGTFDASMITPNAIVTNTTDVITITASANAEIMGLQLWRNSYISPFIYSAERTATGFQDYTATGKLDEIAYYLNNPSAVSSAPKYLCIALGTNGIYASAKALIPPTYIATLDTLISGIKTRATNVNFIITVPAKSNEAIWPVIKPGYTYQNYVDALVTYANTNGYTLVRYDKTQMGTGNTTYISSDGLHPNDAGYQILSSAWCDVLGIPINSSLPLEVINGRVASNFIDATSSIQGQLDSKLPVASPSFTGTLSGPAVSVNNGTNGLIMQAYTGGAGNWAFYKYGVTPSNTNFLFASDGTTTVLNAATTVNLSVGATPVVTASAGLATITGNGSFTGTVTSAQYKLSALNTAPATSTSTGTYGEIRWTTDFMYLCVATNTWVRVALATW